MKKLLFVLLPIFAITACKLSSKNQNMEDNTELSALFEKYYAERIQLLPLEGTQNNDSVTNDKLYADFTDSYRAKLKEFFSRYKSYITKFDRENLNENDKVSYDIFNREMDITLDGLNRGYFGSSITYPDHQYMPFNQFEGLPLVLGQFGSGEGSQPFKTVKDYDNWAARMNAFPAWADSAIVYFRKGIAANIVLPASLVKKMIPQMEAMKVADVKQSLFYGPVTKIPAGFTASDKQRITDEYAKLITEQIIPSYTKLGDFLKNEYLPKARPTTGLSALPNGDKYYKFLIRWWTTTEKTPEEIYQTGLAEVKRIRTTMDSVKNAVGFKGDLNAFFNFMRNDKRFMPFKEPKEVLDSFHSILTKIEPNLDKMFGRKPKSPFEIRQTEAFRAASASAEYNPGSADGTRPGIFYVPILDATKFNTTSGFESLFLHEAIPGHHYQISLQQENDKLPKFRRYAWYGAFGEGWALYTESLGKELGLYTDPYQYMGALGDEIHRAIRLVVDVAMHTKGMTREEAIKYMTDNEAIDEGGATAEIERYMAIPGQALSYKIGALKIRELRKRYENMLGNDFDLADFHDEFLKDGVMPLEVAEGKMNAWAEGEKKK
jgi:uncharacterized protein (DUF885 family)